MEFRKVLALRGPNIWTNFPVFEAWVDLGDLDRPSTDFPGFNDRLMAWLPTMIEHRCSIGERGGFFQRLRQGTYPGHILEHVTLELQTLAGIEVGFGRARETSRAGRLPGGLRVCRGNAGRRMPGHRPRVGAGRHSRSALRREGRSRRGCASWPQEVCLGPSTRAIVEAAAARGIPVRRLNTDSLVQLGHGSRQRRIQARRDRPHRRHRRRDRPRQGTDPHAAGRRGRARARRAAGDGRRGRLGGRRRDRRARWWSSRTTATRAAAWPPT